MDWYKKQAYVRSPADVARVFDVDKFEIALRQAANRFILGLYSVPDDFAKSRGKWAACVREELRDNVVLKSLYGKAKAWRGPAILWDDSDMPDQHKERINSVLNELEEEIKRSLVIDPLPPNYYLGRGPFMGNTLIPLPKIKLSMSPLIDQDHQDLFSDVYNNNKQRDEEVQNLAHILNKEISMLQETQNLVTTALNQLGEN